MSPETNNARVFVLLLTMYMYSSATGTFCAIPSMPTGVPLQVFNAKKALTLISEGKLSVSKQQFRHSCCFELCDICSSLPGLGQLAAQAQLQQKLTQLEAHTTWHICLHDSSIASA